jgi:hypothetical protein
LFPAILGAGKKKCYLKNTDVHTHGSGARATWCMGPITLDGGE